MAQDTKNGTIPLQIWDEWKAVTQPFKDASRRWEEAQERKEAKKKGIKPEAKAVETYEQVIRNNTIDEFVGHLKKYLAEDDWMYVMACEIAEEMKGGAEDGTVE